jgi:hypothetical protein
MLVESGDDSAVQADREAGPPTADDHRSVTPAGWPTAGSRANTPYPKAPAATRPPTTAVSLASRVRAGRDVRGAGGPGGVDDEVAVAAEVDERVAGGQNRGRGGGAQLGVPRRSRMSLRTRFSVEAGSGCWAATAGRPTTGRN